MSSKFKVTFTLDESDANYFRNLYQKAKKGAKHQSQEQIIRDAREIVKDVRSSKKTPVFVQDAITILSDLVDLIQDEAYAAPQKVQSEVLAALAYFSDPEDLIPDHIPGLGFLDDAIMVKFIEDEFKHELWGYRKFRKNRDVSEQRPWASSAKERLNKRLMNSRRTSRTSNDRLAKTRSGWPSCTI